MFAWVNFTVMLISIFLFSYFYIKSVEPVALEKKIGKIAYSRCAGYRLAALIFEIIICINYIVYFFYPLPISLPRIFPWNWWISIMIAVVIAIPAGYLFGKGVKDAGREAMIPAKAQVLFRGIYKQIRHPQAVGELMFWWVIALLLNSPFLVFFSIIWIPVFYLFCKVEEKDLVIRYGRKYLEYRKNTGFIIPKRNKQDKGERNHSEI
jgi:protein-S-isoprenylcysteine O-methyltransferase Ste14